MFWEAFPKYESRQCPCIHKGPYVCLQLNFTIYLDDCWLVGPIFSGNPISESLNAHARTVGGDQEAMHFEGTLRGENENGSVMIMTSDRVGELNAIAMDSTY